MKIIKLLSILFISSAVLNSCSSLGEAGKVLRNEKSTSTDEFLIKKKNPLTQPPDFDVVPKPESIKNEKTKEKNNIKKMLKNSQSKSSKPKAGSTSAENSILNQIKK
jgi:hypothetical protein